MIAEPVIFLCNGDKGDTMRQRGLPRFLAAIVGSALLLSSGQLHALAPPKFPVQLQLAGCTSLGPGLQPTAVPSKPKLVPVAGIMASGLQLSDHQFIATSSGEPTDWAAFASPKLRRWIEISASDSCTASAPQPGERIVDDLPPGQLTGEKRVVDGKSLRIVRFTFVFTKPGDSLGSRYTIAFGGPSTSTSDVVGVARVLTRTGIHSFPTPPGMTVRHRGSVRGNQLLERQSYTFRPSGLVDPFSAQIVIDSGPGPLLLDTLPPREVRLSDQIVGYETARIRDAYRVTRSIGGLIVSVSSRGLPFTKVQQIASSIRLLAVDEAQRRLGTDLFSEPLPQPPTPVLLYPPPISNSIPNQVSTQVSTQVSSTPVTLPAVVVAPTAPSGLPGTTPQPVTPPVIPPSTLPLPSVPAVAAPVTTAMPLSDHNGGPMLVNGNVGSTRWFIRAQTIPGSPDMCTLFRENDQPLLFSGGLPCEIRTGTTRSGIVSLTAFRGVAATYLQITTGPEVRRIRLIGSKQTFELPTVAHPAGTPSTTRLGLAIVDSDISEIQALDDIGNTLASARGEIRPGLEGGWQFRQ